MEDIPNLPQDLIDKTIAFTGSNVSAAKEHSDFLRALVNTINQTLKLASYTARRQEKILAGIDKLNEPFERAFTNAVNSDIEMPKKPEPGFLFCSACGRQFRIQNPNYKVGSTCGPACSKLRVAYIGVAKKRKG